MELQILTNFSQIRQSTICLVEITILTNFCQMQSASKMADLTKFCQTGDLYVNYIMG